VSARRSPSRAAALFVVVGTIVAALVLAATVPEPVPDGAPAVGPRLARRGEISSWFCAEGTSTPDARADERVYVTNLGRAVAHAALTVFSGADQTPVTSTFEVPGRSVHEVHLADVAAVAEPGVLVEVRGGRSVVTHGINGNDDVAIGPCAREPAERWQFAGATTVRGATLWLALLNAYPDDAIVDIRFVTDKGPVEPEALQGFVVPRRSRLTVPVHEHARRDNLVATDVVVRRGRVVAEQSLVLDGSDGRRGLALTLGTARAARRWTVATGAQAEGRTQALAVANPGKVPALVRVVPELDGDAEVAPIELLVPVRSVVPVDLAVIPPDVGFSLAISAEEPVVVETTAAVTAPQPAAARGIATALGSTAAERFWVVSPARASDRSQDAVTVLNSGTRRVSFTARVLHDGAFSVMGTKARITLAPGRRAVLDLTAAEVPTGAALVVTGSGPVVVERFSEGVPGVTLAVAVPGS